ncbi:CocE/NonD family hydrolase [Mycolicibacterium sp.]|uniref:CocE/NonD family hydrolase n=1 Tax=Mycolicibacterium sp. TaxID=2320850 RepID=UPI0028A6715B|nr:CocE/NonD family hydrolase [Mycolicibacterium sp.]
MGASQFVGRVGGLAVALGVGAALFSGAGVAWADRGDTDTSSASSADNDSSTRSARGGRGSESAAPAAATRQANPAAADASLDSAPAIVVEDSIDLPGAAVIDDPEPIVDEPSLPEPPADEPTDIGEPATGEPVVMGWPDPVPEPKIIVDPIMVVEPETTEYVPAPTDEMTAFITGVAEPSDGAGTDPVAPVDSPLLAAFLALARRDPFAAAATDGPAALVTSSSGLTLAPQTTYFDGILQGNLNVTSASGCGTLGSDCKLAYSFVDSSDGGKATLNKVPAALPLGGAGSYTFLPYATWIDPANPTKFPTPTGTQDFTVRVSENTMFNQTVTSIPLIGLIAAPIIQLLQTTPFLGDLLAPLIGASVEQTISVNVGQLVPAGKQVAYTYFVDSFDGTRISMNYFPASSPSLLPALGNQQATIFNGPGLGSAGTIDPYGSSQAAFSAPGLALMRGQGLPGPLASAPLGFNVITWDPRGEWDSGGILQLDNPFYEGRDVSALIDWADANTPLLNEGGKPDVAMMGGSYGGGIQMTTVDPRIKAIVPAIAWNSLNESLYPGGIFKTAWANSLAEALLLTGASSLERVNSQITGALITGNLFAFITESAQAVLASSGPTALMTKLSIPTMYNQGTIDALFPLQQALDNARTQLEENPFFAGANADKVKMIWYCGGHGVCTTQNAQQFSAQLTVMFLENMVWVNRYTKDYLAADPTLNGLLSVTAPFQWWDQNGTALASFDGMPWTPEFQDTAPIVVTQATGGRINSFTSKSGPLTEDDAAGAICAGVKEACGFPLNQVFATKAKNAVNVDIPVVPTTDPNNPSVIVGAPKVSFTYSGIGNAKAVYAQIVDNATGQVLGNIISAIPVTLDGKEHTVEAFPIANIAYTAPVTPGATLTLQIVANSSLYQNTSVNWGVDISDITVSLPTSGTAIKNPVPGLIPA